MAKIKLLSEDLINKIAAGEVIERPASLVKELIENSLDAQANQIIIEIKEAGKKLIRVTDNGTGMDKEDAHSSILRHATSKISSSEDLFSINTLGFRGEALASIAAVSKLKITTKQNEDLAGYSLLVEGGNLLNSSMVAASQGTTIEVKELFFNTPARKKFLKTDAVELRHIINIVTHYALINQEVSFKLLNEEKEIINSPSTGEGRNKIASLYGIILAKELLEVSYSNDEIKVKGYISKPLHARNDRSQQSIFVNGRWIKNKEISEAVHDAFHSLLLVNKFPVFMLALDLNPKKIDVNVHPKKAEIKIEQKEEVYKAVFSAVRQTLETNNLIPIVDFSFEKSVFKKPKSKQQYSFEKSKQTVLQTNDEKEEEKEIRVQPVIKDEQIPRKIEQNIKFPEMKILGQINKTYFVAETPGGALFIDQHVVQERVLYERFMQQYMHKQVAKQTLLQGELIELTPLEKSLVLENQDKLAELGFTLDHFGQNNFVIKTIPTVFGRTQPKELVKEIINQLEERKNSLDGLQEDIITRMSCRSSVKAGDEMTIPHIEKLMAELAECQLPYTCPHGRVIVIKASIDELEKKFKRK